MSSWQRIFGAAARCINGRRRITALLYADLQGAP
jgi:hypothetical protein